MPSLEETDTKLEIEWSMDPLISILLKKTTGLESVFVAPSLDWYTLNILFYKLYTRIEFQLRPQSDKGQIRKGSKKNKIRIGISQFFMANFPSVTGAIPVEVISKKWSHANSGHDICPDIPSWYSLYVHQNQKMSIGSQRTTLLIHKRCDQQFQ